MLLGSGTNEERDPARRVWVALPTHAHAPLPRPHERGSMLHRIPSVLFVIALAGFASGCTMRSMSDDRAACLDHPRFTELMATHEAALNDAALQVIVTLSGEPTDEVADLQDRLLSELEGTEHEVVRRYGNFPILTLQVGSAALCRLVTSLLVEAIQVDEDDPPTDT